MLQQGVCFSAEKQQMLSKIVSDTSESEIELKCLHSSDSNNSISVNKNMEVNFGKENKNSKKSKIFILQEVIN